VYLYYGAVDCRTINHHMINTFIQHLRVI